MSVQVMDSTFTGRTRTAKVRLIQGGSGTIGVATRILRVRRYVRLDDFGKADL